MVFKIDYVSYCKKKLEAIEKEYMILIDALKVQEIDANKLVKGVYLAQQGFRYTESVIDGAKNAEEDS